MKISDQHTYNANIEQIFSFFSIQKVINEKYSSIGAESIKINIKKNDSESDHIVVDTTRKVLVIDKIPKTISKFIGAWSTIHQTESWDIASEEYRCQLIIDIKSVPVNISGTMILKSTKNGCENNVALDVSSKVPFIGNKLVSFVADSAERLITSEYGYISDAIKLIEPKVQNNKESVLVD